MVFSQLPPLFKFRSWPSGVLEHIYGRIILTFASRTDIEVLVPSPLYVTIDSVNPCEDSLYTVDMTKLVGLFNSILSGT